MSSSSNRDSRSGQFSQMGDRITKVAASAIREAVKVSKGAKGGTAKASRDKSLKRSGK